MSGSSGLAAGGEGAAPAAAGEAAGEGEGLAAAWLPGMRAPDWNLTPSPNTVSTAVRFTTASPVVTHWPAGKEEGRLLPCAGSGQPADSLAGQYRKYSHALFFWPAQGWRARAKAP